MPILEFLLGLGVLFTIEASNKVYILVKMKCYSSFLNLWFQSHGFPDVFALFLDKMFILSISVEFSGIVYNRE